MDKIADRALAAQAYDELDELYDEWCAGVVEDVPFYVGLADALAREVGRPLRIVELGAGSGRVTLPLAQSGHSITAIDVAERQLARLAARARVLGIEERLTVLAADMRELAELVAPGSCDLVVAPFRALLHVTRDRIELFSAVRRALTPRGVFAFDVFHPGAEAAAAMDGEWLRRRRSRTASGRWTFHERASTHELPPVDEPSDAAPQTVISLEVRCTYEPQRTRLRQRRTDRPVAEPAPGAPQERLARMELVAVPAHAWLAALEGAGFVIDGAYGWFDGRALAACDDDSAWVARAPGD